MQRLALEVTDELMEKLMEDAKQQLVTPTDIAVSILSRACQTRGNPRWLPLLPPMLRDIAATIDGLCRQGIEVKEKPRSDTSDKA